jgi:hypothetical protein
MNRRSQSAAVVLSAILFGLAAAPAQGPGVNAVMREKLVHTQKILEAVVTSDWNSLETQSRALERLTEDPRWIPLKYPEYAKYSSAFRQSVAALRKAAAAHDLEAAPRAYADVTLRCVECHRYMARSRLAQSVPSPAFDHR